MPVLTSALPTALVALASTLAVAAAPPTSAPRWVWPVEPPRVVRGFDDVGPYEAGHRGRKTILGKIAQLQGE